MMQGKSSASTWQKFLSFKKFLQLEGHENFKDIGRK